MLLKIFIVLMLLAAVASLFSGLFFLYRDHGQGARTARALTVRIGVSLLLFAFLLIGYHAGWFAPGGR